MRINLLELLELLEPQKALLSFLTVLSLETLTPPYRGNVSILKRRGNNGAQA